MKYYIITIFLMLFSVQSWSQATPWYYGGKADGHSLGTLSNFAPSMLAHQAIYAGYKGDGGSMSDLNNFTPTILKQFVAYMGNKGDGGSMSDFSNFSPDVVKQYVAYFGGKGDGWSNQLAQGWPLPLVLLSFEGTAAKEHNDLFWTTNFEENVDYFLLEKSRDAQQFKSIAQVNAVGNSKVENKYSYQDMEDIDGVNYYRLNMTDNDKRFTYSKIVRLVNEQLDYAITIAPNPATDNIRLMFSKALENASRFVIYDMNGKIVIASTIEKDESVKNINISSLSAGKYIIQLNTKNENVHFPFIKQ
nr:T9SS type A sorting domain-containing protein [Chitinophagaceae bacterium]